MKNLIILLALVLSIGQTFAQRKCNGPMEDFLFRQAATAFSLMQQGSKFDKAVRAFTVNQCLSTEQTRRLVALYRDMNQRLDYACYAFSYVVDPQPYPSLADLFPSNQMKEQFFDCIGYQPAPTPINGYTGRIGCGHPVNQGQFMEVKNMLASYPNSITRMDIAKQLIPRNCFTTGQVRELAMLWPNSIQRRDFLYMTYYHTYDIDNYYKMEDMFANSITRREFVEWCMAR